MYLYKDIFFLKPPQKLRFSLLLFWTKIFIKRMSIYYSNIKIITTVQLWISFSEDI